MPEIPCPDPECPGPVLVDTAEGLFHPRELGFRNSPHECQTCHGYGWIEAEEEED